MAGHLLGHYWNTGYNTFLENRSDVCNFAKLVDLHFRQRMNLKFDTNLLLFWSTFWLMDKVTKFSSGIFHLFPKLSKRRSCDREFQIVANWMLQQQWKLSQIPSSTFQRTCSTFFLPQLFPKFSTSTTIIKTWAAPFPRQNKSLVSESSSPKKMQIVFTPLILASEPISVSNDSFVLSMFPEEILLKIGEFAGVEAMRNLIATCKYIRNQLDTWFLQVLASENNPDRATSGFIVDAIGNEGNTCLWRNAKFFIKDHDYSQGPFHSSVRQYNCRENFVWWSALHDYSSIRLLSPSDRFSLLIVSRYSQIPKISFP